MVNHRNNPYVIDATGNGPLWSEGQLLKIASTIYGIDAQVGTRNCWRPKQLIVIGRENFDKDYLLKSVKVGQASRYRCIYLPQETLQEYWWNGHFRTYTQGDTRITYHPGLTFLTQLGFRWPKTDAQQGIGNSVDSAYYNNKSELMNRFGYSVKEGVSKNERQTRLARAVQEPPVGLGLKSVAYWIADLIKWRKAQHSDRVWSAIERYQTDLDWLRDTYYFASEYSFGWPSLE